MRACAVDLGGNRKACLQCAPRDAKHVPTLPPWPPVSPSSTRRHPRHPNSVTFFLTFLTLDYATSFLTFRPLQVTKAAVEEEGSKDVAAPGEPLLDPGGVPVGVDKVHRPRHCHRPIKSNSPTQSAGKQRSGNTLRGSGCGKETGWAARGSSQNPTSLVEQSCPGASNAT